MATQSTQTRAGKSAKSTAKASSAKYNQSYFEKADAAFRPKAEEILQARSLLRLKSLSKLVEDVAQKVAFAYQEPNFSPDKLKSVVENTVDAYFQRHGFHSPESLQKRLALRLIQLSSLAIGEVPRNLDPLDKKTSK